MSNQIDPKVRSIPIQSHIAINQDKEENSTTNRGGKGVAKANIVAKLLRDSSSGLEKTISDKLKKAELGESRYAILQAVEEYIEAGDFITFSRALATMGEKDISDFVDSWIDKDEELTREALNDWSYLKRFVGSKGPISSKETPLIAESIINEKIIESVIAKARAEAPELRLNHDPGVLANVLSRETSRLKKEKSKGNKNKSDGVLGIGMLVIDNNWLVDFYKERRSLMQKMFQDFRVEPLGVLSLECLDFIPEGYIRGELVYSLPLTPGEEATVTQREWVSTKTDFMRQVTDLLEEEQTKEFADKVELAESTMQEKAIEHKAYASAEIGYQGPVTVSIKGGYEYNNNMTTAAKKSTERCRELTTKSASRSKTETKVTFEISQERTRENINQRIIRNTSDKPVRWDFHSLMKKWRIEHWRIGERLTYEIMIPEPGIFLLYKHYILAQVCNELETGSTFNLSPDDIRLETLGDLESEYSVGLDPYPNDPMEKIVEDVVEYSGTPTGGYKTTPEISFPAGYVISKVENAIEDFRPVIDKDPEVSGGPRVEVWPLLEENQTSSAGKSNHQHVWKYQFHGDASGLAARVVFKYVADVTNTAKRFWQLAMHTRLREAHERNWILKAEQLRVQRDALISELERDSLSLRQLEREEIMKNVYRWAFGSDFSFYPSEAEMDGALTGYYDREGSIKLDDLQIENLTAYSEMAAMLDQAIEWEYVNWVLYPYFWSHPMSRPFKMWFKHNDFYHQQFLRAGCAKVRITIRPDYEEDWLKLVEGVDDVSTLPSAGIIETLRDRAMTTYNYIPNPNRDELMRVGTHLDTWWEYTPTGALDVTEGKTE